MKPDMNKLVRLFGTAGNIARAAGVTPGAVSRWGRYEIAPVYQDRLVKAAKEQGIRWIEVAWAAGVPQCPHCGLFHYGGKRRAL
jgi:hypothetical protein